MNRTTGYGSTKRIVVFSGAGISAESGIRTFRDSGGLWEEYRIEEVATPEAWSRDPERVLHFYDMRRDQVIKARPNAAHIALANLEKHFQVDVVTQNIDDLHERAGSTNVLHLHGEILKARSTKDPELVIPISGTCLAWGAKCALGSQLRPHIVWFGEEVPLLPVAAHIVARADVLIVVGTSLQVYPAAGLVDYAQSGTSIYVVDPEAMEGHLPNSVHIKAPASIGVPIVVEELLRSAGISE